MTETQSGTMSVFNIRNLLVMFAGFLTVIAVGLAFFGIMQQALNNADVAERAQLINRIVDEVTVVKQYAARARTAAATSYGFTGRPDPQIAESVTLNIASLERAFGGVLRDLQDLGDFNGKSKMVSDFTKAERELLTVRGTLDEDLRTVEAGRTMNSQQALTLFDDLIEKGAALRRALLTNFNLGSAQIQSVATLKTQLWSITEYASREANILGSRIANGSQLDGFLDLPRLGEYGGRIQAAWTTVTNLADSGLVSSDIQKTTEEIESVFFEDFTFTKDEIYEASEYEEDYPVSPGEWISAAETAVAPIFKMNDLTSAFAISLTDDAVSAAETQLLIATLVLVLVIALAAAGLFIIFTRVIGPLNAMSDVMMVLAGGNLEVSVPFADRMDEVGSMARSANVFKENALERQRLEAEQRQREVEDQKRRAEEERRTQEAEREREEKERASQEARRQERRQEMLNLADQFEKSVMGIVEGVSASAQNMTDAAQKLTQTAEDTSRNSDLVTQAATNASENAQMVASAAEELSSSVREITGQTNQSSQAARDAVGRTVEASKDIGHLDEAAQKIGDVVQLINDIAEQTNLLALNATIEAARAGDAGKGFAVVASEVKSLANQTANATSEISSQVEGMQSATTTAVSVMDQIKDIISDIESTAVSIASAVEEQDSSTQEIARNVGEVSVGTDEVKTNILEVNQGATDTGSAASDVLSAAQILSTQSDDLRNQVENFLSTIRTSNA